MSRLTLQTHLETLLGSENVYFQAPPSNRMAYPCIVYSLSKVAVRHADNAPYTADIAYTVTVITKDPDSLLPGKFNSLQKCSFDRHFTSDNLHHYVYTLFW